jgi:hypothetical protein
MAAPDVALIDAHRRRGPFGVPAYMSEGPGRPEANHPIRCSTASTPGDSHLQRCTATRGSYAVDI